MSDPHKSAHLGQAGCDGLLYRRLRRRTSGTPVAISDSSPQRDTQLEPAWVSFRCQDSRKCIRDDISHGSYVPGHSSGLCRQRKLRWKATSTESPETRRGCTTKHPKDQGRKSCPVAPHSRVLGGGGTDRHPELQREACPGMLGRLPSSQVAS